MTSIPLLAAAATAVLYPRPAPLESPPAECPDRPAAFQADSAAPGVLRRLDRLPSADLYRTVYRNVAGCPAPLVVRLDKPAQR